MKNPYEYYKCMKPKILTEILGELEDDIPLWELHLKEIIAERDAIKLILKETNQGD